MEKSVFTVLGILSIVMVVVSISGCTSNTNAQTYKANGISFQYPSDYTLKNSTMINNDLLLYLSNFKENANETTILTIMTITPGDSLNARINQKYNYMNSNNKTILGEGSTQIAGVSGYRIDYSSTNENPTVKDATIFFVKNNKYYEIDFVTRRNIADINSEIDTVVNSFQTYY